MENKENNNFILLTRLIIQEIGYSNKCYEFKRKNKPNYLDDKRNILIV